ncbi:MAG: uracil-DNA glycosylase, partial [Actinobacteria bacterium]|nr:uracil-DNA glycosylase [Actinomycetota bacterium]
MPKHDELDKLAIEIIDCHKCTRLVKWREKVSVEKRAAYVTESYWGKPIVGFGDKRA